MAAIAGLLPLHRRRQDRMFKERLTLDDLRETEILSRYRLNRAAILRIEELLHMDLRPKTDRSMPIPVITKVLIGLRFMAKGDFLSEVGDLHGVSRSSACNIIDDFIDSINRRLDNIRFPQGRELLEMKQEFYNKCRIPQVIGAVDGTLIAITAPSEHEAIYVCRKNFHAINVQGVVDIKGRFIDVVSRWPGSTHDAAIFDNCGLKNFLQTNHHGHLLGDSGYPLRTYLLTPVLRPAHEQERAYNNAHARGRCIVERAFGIMKSRFRCLHKTGGFLCLKPDKVCRLVEACARLHNFCIDMNVPMPDNYQFEGEEEEINPQDLNADINAGQYRQQIIAMF